jgi:hypothetical protein
MNAKLTLNLEKNVIEDAKMYAKMQRISLSKLIEIYLHSLNQVERKTKVKISPLVESLTGIIPNENINDYKTDYHNYLLEKYS